MPMNYGNQEVVKGRMKGNNKKYKNCKDKGIAYGSKKTNGGNGGVKKKK